MKFAAAEDQSASDTIKCRKNIKAQLLSKRSCPLLISMSEVCRQRPQSKGKTEKLTNNLQPIHTRKLSNTCSLPIIPPPLPLFRNHQIQWLSSTIPGYQNHSNISMFSSFLWRRRSFILHQLLDIAISVGTQPMAYLTPFRVVAGRGIRVCKGKHVFYAMG